MKRKTVTNRCNLGVQCARTALAVRARALCQLSEAVRAEEVEGIHQMRVASRRLRAALSEFAPVTGACAAPFLGQVREVTRGLGRARELDVMMGMLLEQRPGAAAPLLPALAFALRQLRRLRQAESGACRRVAALVASDDIQQSQRLLLDGLTPAPGCHVDYVRRRLLNREKGLRRAFRRWQETGHEPQLHEVRIAFKKIRYACEVHADLYGTDMADYLARLKGVQQLLGDWNDCRVLRDQVAALAGLAPGAARREMPRLARQWDKRAAKHLAKFQRKAPAFFDKKHARRARALFDAPAVSCEHEWEHD